MAKDPTIAEFYNKAPFTRHDLESALDSGRLEVQWQNGKWYAVRRNGRTKLWKTRPEWFRIPCKSGFRDQFAIGDESRLDVAHYPSSPYLRIRLAP